MKPGIIALEGPLGAGKTSLTKVLAKLLGINEEIVSPTFVLHRPYTGLHHIDCWRMESGEELEQLGFKKMLDAGSLIVVEWAEKFRSQILDLRSRTRIVWVKIEYGEKKNVRKIQITNIK